MEIRVPPQQLRSGSAVWVVLVAVTSFLVTFVLVDQLAAPRNVFVLGHVVVSGMLLAVYARVARVRAHELIGDWRRGLVGGLAAGAMMVGFVLAGPRSPAPNARTLVGAIVWLGLVYGTIDALLLSVFPVIAARRFYGDGTYTGAPGARAVPLAALGTCVLVTATYHLGFPEFRGSALAGALIGNVIMTISYLASRSAVSPVLAHIGLHLAAVTFGYTNAIPTPPHYG